MSWNLDYVGGSFDSTAEDDEIFECIHIFDKKCQIGFGLTESIFVGVFFIAKCCHCVCKTVSFHVGEINIVARRDIAVKIVLSTLCSTADLKR